MMIAHQTNILFSNASKLLACGRVLSRTYYKERFSYENIYRGAFEQHDQIKYPRSLPAYKEEELLEEIHAIKGMQITEPSPFHVVRRIKTMSYLPWNQKVTLRRLNLHSTFNGECVLVPNTPQFNALILKVKHLLTLKPAKFVDGRVPTADDIGAIKLCPYTGTIKVDEKIRLLSKRLHPGNSVLFRGNHLRSQIDRKVGINYNNFSPKP